MLVFWGAFFCGQIIFAIFDFFRALRKNYACGRKTVAIQDIIFCGVSFKIFFDICYITNNGHLRWYIFVSFVLSGIIYFLAESPCVMKIWNLIFKIIGIFLKPARKLIGFFGSILKKLWHAIKTGILSPFAIVLNKIRQSATKNGQSRQKTRILFSNFFSKKSFTFRKK